MKTKTILITLLIATFISCVDNAEIPIDSENLLLGNWINVTYENETISFDRAAALQKDKPGVSFKNNAVFVERTSGWCGTPPLFFQNNEGKFTVAENTIKVTIDLFPGDFQWKIIKLTNEKLIVKREVSAQEKDHRKLMELFDEIYAIATSKTCTDVSEWKIIAYGSKACGGAQGHIPYSTKINEDNFLDKVQRYTEAEDAFNKKWSIVSTCEVITPPTTIVCRNGYPVLEY